MTFIKTIQKLRGLKGPQILIGTFILLLVILRLPSIFEPHWNSDEGLFASIASTLGNGALLYEDVWDHKPPAIFAIYSLANYAGSLNLVMVKILSLLFSIATLILIYKTAKKLAGLKVGVLSAFIATLLLGLPVIESNIANCENFFVFFTTLGIYLCLDEGTVKNLLAGLSFGVASLFSITPFFELIALILYFSLLCLKAKKYSKNLKSILCILATCSIPWLLTLFYFSYKGIIDEFLYASFTFNLESIREISTNSLGFVIFPNTILSRIIILTIALIFIGKIYLKANSSDSWLFITLWITFNIFSILFFQKAYPHLLIQIVPAFSILTGLLLSSLRKVKFEKKLVKFGLFILSVIFVLNLFTEGFPFPQTLHPVKYYINFYKYLSGKIDTVSYSKTFGEETYNSYRLNTLLRQNFSDIKNTYVWTSDPWIYYLADLDTPVRYLKSSEASFNWGEVKSSLVKNPPELVIIDSNSQPSYNLLIFLEENNYEFERNFENYRLYLYNNQ